MLDSFQKTFNGNSFENAEKRISKTMRCVGNSNIVADCKMEDHSLKICTGNSSYTIPSSDIIAANWMNEPTISKLETTQLQPDDIIETILRKLSVKPILKHQCTNCMAVLELDINKRIFHCPYCNAVYAISEG